MQFKWEFLLTIYNRIIVIEFYYIINEMFCVLNNEYDSTYTNGCYKGIMRNCYHLENSRMFLKILKINKYVIL